jgi:phosphatidylserine decarboxylase
MSATSHFEQMEVNPYPSSLQSGWLPPLGSESLRQFFEYVLNAPRQTYAPCIRALQKFIKEHGVLEYLVRDACKENLNLIAYHQDPSDVVSIPRIGDLDTLLHGFNHILTHAPAFYNDDLVGLPFSALVVGIDATLGGSTLFRLPMFNEKMSEILQVWNSFLETEASNVGFRIEGKQWLSDKAKAQYEFPIWKKDSEQLPYWKSWNSFFTRGFKDPNKSRPIADPNSNQTVICPNDGSLFRWDANLARTDVFWFKDMRYSLSDILSSPVPAQQKLIDDYGLVDIFKGGYIFQTYLNPYNYHRWWVPVNGRVLFDPCAIPGCFFSKLILPDFGGATTASTPYLAQVNARGLIVFKTEDYGHVCCLPLGMSEVSSVVFDPAMKQNAQVRKGQEMGTFEYGGSSFAVLYEKPPNKELIFVNADGVPYPQRPVLPTSSSGTGGAVTNIGAQIGIWYSKNQAG